MFEWVLILGLFLPSPLLVYLVLVWLFFVFYVYIGLVSIVIFSLSWLTVFVWPVVFFLWLLFGIFFSFFPGLPLAQSAVLIWHLRFLFPPQFVSWLFVFFFLLVQFLK